MGGVRPALLYDADCGFCTRSAGLASRLSLDVEVAALQSVDLTALGVSPRRARAEIPFVGSDGSVRYGHAAIAAALRTGPLPLRLVGALLVFPGVGAVGRLVYRWVSRHRHQLPGGTSACVLPPTDDSTGDPNIDS